MAFTTNIKCKNFCNYNKGLFCPFYMPDFGSGDSGDSGDETNFTESENIELLDEIIFKVRETKPLPKRKRNDVDVWMTFSGNLYLSGVFNKIVVLEFINGIMTDLSSGEFVITGKISGWQYNGLNISSVSGSGNIFLSYDEDCDFGGDISFSMYLNYGEKEPIVVPINGHFTTDRSSINGTLGGYVYSGVFVQEGRNTKNSISFITSM